MNKEVNDITKELSDEQTIVHDFIRRQPFWDYIPTRYKVLDHFSNLKEEIDGYLEKLFAGDIDSGNEDVLDNLIMDVSKQATKALANQHTDHRELINSFNIRARSDYKAFSEQLQKLRASLDENKRRQALYRSLSDRDEFGRRA